MTPKYQISFMDGPIYNVWKNTDAQCLPSGNLIRFDEIFKKKSQECSNQEFSNIEKGPSINDIRFFGFIFDPPSPLSPIFLLY